MNEIAIGRISVILTSMEVSHGRQPYGHCRPAAESGFDSMACQALHHIMRALAVFDWKRQNDGVGISGIIMSIAVSPSSYAMRIDLL